LIIDGFTLFSPSTGFNYCLFVFLLIWLEKAAAIAVEFLEKERGDELAFENKDTHFFIINIELL
jgi:hypothetical protein